MSNRAITLRNHPFPFLLYVEWGLLVLAVVMELVRPLQGTMTLYSMLAIATMLIFGAMGLRLPMRNSFYKWLYTSGQIGLIVLGIFVFLGRSFPLLELVVVIRSALIFRLPGRLAVTAIAFGLFITSIAQSIIQAGSRLDVYSLDTLASNIWRVSQRMLVYFGINSSVLFGLSLIMVLLLMNALVAERESREQLIQTNEQLRDYVLRVESLAMEQERNRIAREIHDSLGHSLTALNLQIEGALKLAKIRPEDSQAFLREAKRLGSTALQDVRQSVATLRTNPLKDKTLAEAIATLTTDFHRTTQIHPDVRIDLETEPSIEIATTVYRVIQEALTNIFKHAEATAVTIQLRTDTDSSPSSLELTVTDNGKGFERSSSQHSGFGLQGMEERVLAVRGELRIWSELGEGCRIWVRVEG